MRVQKMMYLLLCCTLLGTAQISYGAETKAAAQAEAKQAQTTTVTIKECIKPQFDDCRGFSEEGLAAAKKGDKWGYINTKGEWVIKPIYAFANNFNEGKAIVFEQNMEESYFVCYVKVIDTKGNAVQVTGEDGDLLLDGFLEKGTDCFYNGYAQLDDAGSIGYLFNTKGEIIFPSQCKAAGNLFYCVQHVPTEGLIPASNGKVYDVCSDKCQYFDINGNVKLDLTKKLDAKGNGTRIVDIRPFNQGLAPVCVGTFKNSEMQSWAWGFINKEGKFVIKPQSRDFWVSGLNSKYTVFMNNVGVVQNEKGKWGGIDKTGKTVIPFEYDLLAPSSEEMPILFMKDGKYGYMDFTGKVVIQAEYDKASSFGEGFAIVHKEGKYYIITADGSTVKINGNVNMESYFEDSEETFMVSPSEYIIIKENGHYGYLQIIK